MEGKHDRVSKGFENPLSRTGSAKLLPLSLNGEETHEQTSVRREQKAVGWARMSHSCFIRGNKKTRRHKTNIFVVRPCLHFFFCSLSVFFPPELTGQYSFHPRVIRLDCRRSIRANDGFLHKTSSEVTTKTYQVLVSAENAYFAQAPSRF